MCTGSKYLRVTPEVLKLLRKADKIEFHENSAVFIKDNIRSYVELEPSEFNSMTAEIWLNDSFGDAIKALIKADDKLLFLNHHSDFSTNSSISRGIEIDGIFLYIERDNKAKYRFLISAKPRTI
jgi:hypothetical protein